MTSRYYDPVSDGFYYEHNGSRGWRKRNPKLHGTPGSVMQQQQAMKAAAAAEAEQQQAAAAAAQAQQSGKQQSALALAAVMGSSPAPASLGSVAGKFTAGAGAAVGVNGTAGAAGGVPNIK